MRAAVMNEMVNVETQQVECPLHGPYEAARLRLGVGTIPWSICPTCAAERDQKAEAEKRSQITEARLKTANIPRRHATATLDSFRTDTDPQRKALQIVRAYLEHFPEHLAAGRCLLFYGKTGTGKTHLAVALSRALVESGRSAHYTTVADLIARIRQTWNRQSTETEAEVMQFLRRLDLLVLDEVGVQNGTDAERVQITNLIDARYRDLKPTLVITNCGRDELRDYLGDRVLSRLRENGGKGVVFDWADYRGNGQ